MAKDEKPKDTTPAPEPKETPQPADTKPAESVAPEPKLEPKVEPKPEPAVETKPDPTPEPKIDKDELYSEFRERMQQEEEERKQQQEQSTQQVIKGWYDEYDTMVELGKAPKIENANDKNDPGVKARSAMIRELAKQRESGKNIRTLSQVMLANPSVLSAPPGGDAPISGESAPLNDGSNYKHSDIRTKTFAEIASDLNT